MMEIRVNKWGVGSGEWGMGMGKQFPCPHSPLPTPHSLLALFILFALFASAVAKDRLEAPPLTGRELNLQPLSYTGPGAGPKSGRVPMTPYQSQSEVKKLWGEAENLRTTGAVESLRAAMSKYEEALRLLHSVGKAADPGEIAYTLHELAAIAHSLGDLQQAINCYKQALQLWRAANDRQSQVRTLTQIGRVSNSLGAKQEAQRLFEQARLI